MTNWRYLAIWNKIKIPLEAIIIYIRPYATYIQILNKRLILVFSKEQISSIKEEVSFNAITSKIKYQQVQRVSYVSEIIAIFYMRFLLKSLKIWAHSVSGDTVTQKKDTQSNTWNSLRAIKTDSQRGTSGPLGKPYRSFKTVCSIGGWWCLKIYLTFKENNY